MIQAQAPGKLILLGEHSVVYGHRAIAAAVSRYTRVTLHPSPGPARLGSSSLRDSRLLQALALALPEGGWRADITTELPIGRGMGSSAALSIALLRAAALSRGEEPDFEELHRRGFELERLFHGNPSGLDHAVSALGGAVLYRRGEAPRPLPMRPLRVVVLDSGRAGDTGALVAGVASRRPGVDPLLERLGSLVEELVRELSDPDAVAEAMNEGHALLRGLGVSNSELDELVRLARANGATGAKLSGAGGGGVVVALTPDGGQTLLHAASTRGIHAFRCTLPES